MDYLRGIALIAGLAVLIREAFLAVRALKK